ncbi:hypothetical protein [Streptomyces sp. NBC_01006]|nr:hypothetical protein OG509_38320 [Streptomyces sp. NBC_01006]
MSLWPPYPYGFSTLLVAPTTSCTLLCDDGVSAEAVATAFGPT